MQHLLEFSSYPKVYTFNTKPVSKIAFYSHYHRFHLNFSVKLENQFHRDLENLISPLRSKYKFKIRSKISYPKIEVPNDLTSLALRLQYDLAFFPLNKIEIGTNVRSIQYEKYHNYTCVRLLLSGCKLTDELVRVFTKSSILRIRLFYRFKTHFSYGPKIDISHQFYQNRLVPIEDLVIDGPLKLLNLLRTYILIQNHYFVVHETILEAYLIIHMLFEFIISIAFINSEILIFDFHPGFLEGVYVPYFYVQYVMNILWKVDFNQHINKIRDQLSFHGLLSHLVKEYYSMEEMQSHQTELTKGYDASDIVSENGIYINPRIIYQEKANIIIIRKCLLNKVWRSRILVSSKMREEVFEKLTRYSYDKGNVLVSNDTVLSWFCG